MWIYVYINYILCNIYMYTHTVTISGKGRHKFEGEQERMNERVWRQKWDGKML